MEQDNNNCSKRKFGEIFPNFTPRLSERNHLEHFVEFTEKLSDEDFKYLFCDNSLPIEYPGFIELMELNNEISLSNSRLLSPYSARYAFNILKKLKEIKQERYFGEVLSIRDLIYLKEHGKPVEEIKDRIDKIFTELQKERELQDAQRNVTINLAAQQRLQSLVDLFEKNFPEVENTLDNKSTSNDVNDNKYLKLVPFKFAKNIIKKLTKDKNPEERQVPDLSELSEIFDHTGVVRSGNINKLKQSWSFRGCGSYRTKPYSESMTAPDLPVKKKESENNLNILKRFKLKVHSMLIWSWCFVKSLVSPAYRKQRRLNNLVDKLSELGLVLDKKKYTEALGKVPDDAVWAIEVMANAYEKYTLDKLNNKQ